MIWEIICGNVGQSQEGRRCGDERVLKFKVNFQRTVNLISNHCIFKEFNFTWCFNQFQSPNRKWKYFLQMLAGLSSAISFQRFTPRLLTISPDLLRKFIYTWCFNQCQSPERYWNKSENFGCTSKKVPQSLFPRTRLSSQNSKFISGWQLRCRGRCSRACRFWLQHFSWSSLIGEGGLGPRSL